MPVEEFQIDDGDDVRENYTYEFSANISSIIFHAGRGTVVEATTARKGEPTYALYLTGEGVQEAPVAQAKDGSRYKLRHRYYGPNHQYEGNPWLRTLPRDESLGEIWSLRVLKWVQS